MLFDRKFLAVALAALVTISLAAPVDAEQQRGTGVVYYNLGDKAFPPPFDVDYVGDNELNGMVWYPPHLTRGTHPLILIEHGNWHTCADRRAKNAQDAAVKKLTEDEQNGDTEDAAIQQKIIQESGAALYSWPCVPNVRPLPSYQGYDYLARQLAARGFVVVSIGTNGINATSAGQAPSVYLNRAALANKHLELWQQLSATGQGPLRGKFTDPASGRSRDVDFTGHVDLTNVGTIGHSMGGGGVFQQAADGWHDKEPAGVDIKAVFGLAPTFNWNGDPVTRIPFAVMWGTCDAVNTGSYFEDNAGKATAPLYKYTLTGGNHDYYNTQWSPSSGQVGAYDDARPGATPGTCSPQFPSGGPQNSPDARKLTEQQQRYLTAAYVSAFFQKFLRGSSRYDALLDGRQKLAGAPDVVTVRRAGA
jgi:hypothetical protein